MSHPRRHNGLVAGEWVVLTLLAAVVATGVEAVLLERKIGLLTGGFQADLSLGSPAQRVWFLLVSLVSDAAVLGLIVAGVLWLCARYSLKPAGRVLFALGLALLPVVWFDFVSYQLHQYIGDVLNLRVLFDLSGGRLSEFLAVAAPQIAVVLALLVAGLAGLVGVAWGLNRVVPLIEAGDGSPRRSRGRLVAQLALVMAVGGLVFTTGARLTHEATDRGMARKATGVFMGTIVQFSTDVDRDGYGLLSRPADPAPFNAAIHPYALEVPGNGIDENGIGGDLPVAFASYAEGPAEAPRFTRRPPVVFVVLESFRADLIFRERAGREVTPYLNRLAREGTFTDRAYSHNGWTQQSRYHIFTGSLAGPRGRTSLIDDFNANGYDTGFFSAQDESDPVHLDVGFSRATASYDAPRDAALRYSASATPGSIALPHTLVEQRVAEYLDSRDPSAPLFLHVNFQETHFPYGHAGLQPLVSDVVSLTRAEIHPGRREVVRAVYDNAAANVDAAVERTVGLVRAHTGEAPLVVVIADHGESLFDDGFLGHGIALNDSQTRVPLVISEPGAPLEEPVGQSDVRTLVWRLLTGDASWSAPAGASHLEARKIVFQYMGDVRRPRQLGLVTDGGRVRLDMHEHVVHREDGVATPLRLMDGEAAQGMARLIYLWESLLLAGAPGVLR